MVAEATILEERLNAGEPEHYIIVENVNYYTDSGKGLSPAQLKPVPGVKLRIAKETYDSLLKQLKTLEQLTIR